MTGPICDSQVHAPDLEGSLVPGFAPATLLEEMARTGVDRVVIVPPTVDGSLANNTAALEFAQQEPEKIAVMGLLPLHDGPVEADTFAQLRAEEGLLGIRVTFFREADRKLLENNEIDWLWRGAESADLPLIVLAPGNLPALGDAATRFPGLRIIVDHLGLTPGVTHEGSAEVQQAIEPLLALSGHPNIAAKASALPNFVTEAYPFPSLHDPLKSVVDAFGANRVFWGSDLSRIRCTYSECLGLFSEELDFLSATEKEWILGRGICEWLHWD